MDPYLFKIQIEDIPPILDYMTWLLQHRRRREFLENCVSEPATEESSLLETALFKVTFSAGQLMFASGIMQKKVVGGLEHVFHILGIKYPTD